MKSRRSFLATLATLAAAPFALLGLRRRAERCDFAMSPDPPTLEWPEHLIERYGFAIDIRNSHYEGWVSVPIGQRFGVKTDAGPVFAIREAMNSTAP